MKRGFPFSPSPLVWLVGLLGLSLACSLTVIDEPTITPSGAGLGDTSGAPPPIVQIVSPANGQQVSIGQAVEISVLATDQIGVTRLQLNVGSRTGSTKAFPEAATTAEALLTWQPDREGTFELQVIAYRQTAYSEPALLTLQVVGRGDPVSNPVSGQTTVVATSGDCVGRVLIGNLRIRSGPGQGFDIQGNFDLNEQVTVIGQNSDGTWWKIRRLDNSENWAINNSEWMQVTGTCNSVPVVQ